MLAKAARTGRVLLLHCSMFAGVPAHAGSQAPRSGVAKIATTAPGRTDKDQHENLELFVPRGRE